MSKFGPWESQGGRATRFASPRSRRPKRRGLTSPGAGRWCRIGGSRRRRTSPTTSGRTEGRSRSMTRTNGQVKAPPDTAKVEVILPTAVHKRHVTKFETDAADADVTNI